jgi:acyl carrier protein
VLDPSQPSSMGELRQWLRDLLPEHSIPAALVSIEALPLLPNGKVDRLALPEHPRDDRQVSEPHVPPATEVELTIADVWRDVLQTRQIGIHDNFFDLGGHSLLLFQVYGKLGKLLDKKFSITDLFRYPTVSALAAYFSQDASQAPSLLQHVLDRVQKQKQAHTAVRY